MIPTKTNQLFRDNFAAALHKRFPEVLQTHQVTSEQLREVMKDLKTDVYPWYMTNKRISRGVFYVGDGVAPKAPAGSNTGNKTKSPKSNITSSGKSLAEITHALNFNNDAGSVGGITIPHADLPAAPKVHVAAAQPAFDVSSLIPKRDPHYVAFGNHNDVVQIIKSGIFYPTFICGPTGNGKSTMVEQVCAQYKKPLIRINFNAGTDEEQLIGSKTLIDGNVEIVEGPVLLAMRHGLTILLDEIDAGQANTLMCLQPILEGKPYYFKIKNELIHPTIGFNIIATANTKGKGSDDGRYIGTKVLNEAFLERFAVTFEQDYPPTRAETKIITNLMAAYDCLDEEYANVLVKWAECVRKTAADGAFEDID